VKGFTNLEGRRRQKCNILHFYRARRASCCTVKCNERKNKHFWEKNIYIIFTPF